MDTLHGNASHKHAQLRVRSNLHAGKIVCFEDSGGILTPVDIGSYYPYIPPSLPVPPYQPTGNWLPCKSCTGTQIAPGKLMSAKCEVCG